MEFIIEVVFGVVLLAHTPEFRLGGVNNRKEKSQE
jgi:hypothetical protein